MKKEDFASAVQKFNFGKTFKEQEEQLKTNPLMQRFAGSREKMADDPYRPIYHFVSPESTMNDPNGLCFWQGRWHLFYQGYPPEDRREHWGHAVSDDLIHWRDLPYAIYPNPEQCCYSGATLVEDNRVIAMYHGTRAGNMLATSSDPLLLNWEKITGGSVIPMFPEDVEDARWRAPDGTRTAFAVFDPCIWEKEGSYYSLSGERLPNGPSGKPIRANFLFRSEDLINWEYLHPFVEGDRFTIVGDDGACPYFWPIGGRHILLFFSHISGGQAFLGDYDRKRDKFAVTSHYKFNFGARAPAGVHAPSAAPDGRGGIIVIFNMNPGKPTAGWNQIMTLPRHLALIGEDELKIEPVGAVESLRYNHQRIETTELPANREVVLHNIRGNAMEIITEIDPGNAPLVELNVLRSPGREEFTRIAFFGKRGYRNRGHRKDGPEYSLVSIDSSYSSMHPDARSRAPESAPVLLDEGEPLTLRVFVDRSVVEVFINEKQCSALRVYPSRGDSVGVSLRSQGQSALIKSLDAWQMKSIY